jgi:Cdc6-like AAA superfamily ATPase
MALEQKDLEAIERLIYKQGDDIAISIARSFERLEERIDATESRLYSRLAEVEDRVEASRQDTSDQLGELRDEVRELIRVNSSSAD